MKTKVQQYAEKVKNFLTKGITPRMMEKWPALELAMAGLLKDTEEMIASPASEQDKYLKKRIKLAGHLGTILAEITALREYGSNKTNQIADELEKMLHTAGLMDD